jgi:DNA polymerase-1
MQARRIDLGILPAVDSMTANGIRLDIPHLRSVGLLIDKQLAQIEGEIESILDPLPVPLLSSPQQISDLLFRTLQVQGNADVPRTPKTGRYSTEERYVKQFADNHPFIPALLTHRGLSKLKGTYVESLIKQADSESIVRGNINVTKARTGRLSMDEPNLQQIPRPTGEGVWDVAEALAASGPLTIDWGRMIRNAFIARPGRVLTSCDQSQIELRVLAHLSQDKNFLSAYLQGTDLHALTASLLFKVPIAQVTKRQRSAAKTINFAIVYGISAQGLQLRLLEDAGYFDLEECQSMIQRWLHIAYPGVGQYLQSQFERAQRFGAVWTMFGRTRWLPEARSANQYRRAAALRQAGNTPIQGSAGDTLKIGFGIVWPEIEAWGDDWLLLLQVHDEGISETWPRLAEQQTAIFKSALESATTMRVPIVASGDIAERWGDLK